MEKQRKFDCDGLSGEFAGSLEPAPTETVEPSVIVGEAYNINRPFFDALPSYSTAPHISFANIPNGDNQAALRFVCEWGPLKKSHYVGEFDPEDPGAAIEFMVPLKQFWKDHKRFVHMIGTYTRYHGGEFEDKSDFFSDNVIPNDTSHMDSLINTLNQVTAKHKPRMEFIPEFNQIMETVPGGLLIELLFCLRNDIVGGKRILKCADPNCKTFFRPSRPSQIYHTQACLQRHHARERRKNVLPKK